MQRYSQSPTDPDFVQNPYAFYDKTRETGPIFWWDDYDLTCLSSHKAVSAALRDRRMGREVPAEMAPTIPDAAKPFYDIEAHSMLELEPPRHTRLRGLVLRSFTSRMIAGLAPDIENLSNSLIDQFPTGPFDLLAAYAQPLPVIVIARMLGVPETDADQLLRWSNAMVAMYLANRSTEVERAAAQASTDFTTYLRDYIVHKTRFPADDLISTLIAAHEDGQRLSEAELISTCILLLNAGHEATVHTTGNGVKTLLETGITDTSTTAIEEIIRYDPPLHMFTRYIYEDIEIEGENFKRGDQIACLLGAANRDPIAYNNPHQFNPTRKGPANTSFGGGIHFCVGAPLARLELQISLSTLLKRVPKLRLTTTPQYANVYHFHGLKNLMVEV